MNVPDLLAFSGHYAAGLFFFCSLCFFSFSVALRSFGSSRSSLICCAAAVTGMSSLQLLFHILAGPGMFRIWKALAAMALLSLAAHRYLTPLHAVTEFVSGQVHGIQSLFSQKGVVFRIATALFMLFALLTLARDLILPPLSWDTLIYHGTKAALWAQNGTWRLFDAPGGWSCSRAFPGGGEVFQAFVLLLFKNDFLLGANDFVQWGLLFLTAYTLGRQVGLDLDQALTGATYCSFLPIAASMVGGGYVDILYALATTLAMVFAIAFFSGKQVKFLVLACLSLSIAGSVKFTAIFTIVMDGFVIGLFILRHVRRPAFPAVKALATVVPAIAVLIIPWLIYNTIQIGTPFAVVSFKIGNFSLGKDNALVAWYQNRPGIDAMAYHLFFEAVAFMANFDFMEFSTFPDYGLSGIFVLLLFPVALIRLFAVRSWESLFILLHVSSVFLFFYLPSFSAVRLFWAQSNARFLLPAFIPMAMVGMAGWSKTFRRLLLVGMIAASIIHFVCLLKTQWLPYEYAAAAPLITISVLAFLAFRNVVSKRVPSAFRGVALLLTVSLILLSVMPLRDALRYKAAAASFFFHTMPRYWVEAAQTLNNGGPPAKIAVTSDILQNGDNWFSYLFFGPDIKNTVTYVPISSDGQIIDWDPRNTRSRLGVFQAWRDRLCREKVDYVFSFAPPAIELIWMIQHPEDFQPVVYGKTYGLFRVVAGESK